MSKKIDYSPGSLSFQVIRGDTFVYPFTWRWSENLDGRITREMALQLDIVDTSGMLALLQVKKNPNSEISALELTHLNGGILLDANNDPNVTIVITAEQSEKLLGDYFYDLQMTDINGSIKTLLSGKLTFVQDVSRYR